MNNQDEKKLAEAHKRIKCIKGFYTHLSIYILVNIFILAGNTNFFTDFVSDNYWFWRYFSSPVFWGIGLLIHGLKVFMPSLNFVKRWEDRKINELMENDSRNIKY